MARRCHSMQLLFAPRSPPFTPPSHPFGPTMSPPDPAVTVPGHDHPLASPAAPPLPQWFFPSPRVQPGLLAAVEAMPSCWQGSPASPKPQAASGTRQSTSSQTPSPRREEDVVALLPYGLILLRAQTCSLWLTGPSVTCLRVMQGTGYSPRESVPLQGSAPCQPHHCPCCTALLPAQDPPRTPIPTATGVKPIHDGDLGRTRHRLVHPLSPDTHWKMCRHPVQQLISASPSLSIYYSKSKVIATTQNCRYGI